MLIIFAEIVLVSLLVSADWAANQTVEEHRMIASQMGSDTAQAVSARADDWYDRWIVETGVVDAFRSAVPTEEEKAASRGLENSFDLFFEYELSRIEALLDVVYWALKRLALLLLWLPVTAPVFLLALGDGFLQRKIRMQTFAFSSPLIQEAAGSIAIATTFVILLLFFLPFAVPPLAAPALLAVASLFLGISVANLRKRI